MGTLTDAKTLYGGSATAGGFSNEEVWTKVTYDFSDDGGETEDNIIITAGSSLVITDYYLHVTTAASSPAAAVIDVGMDAGGAELGSDITTATLTEDYLVGFIAGGVTKLRLGVGETIVMGVESSTLAAGVFDFYFKTIPLA